MLSFRGQPGARQPGSHSTPGKVHSETTGEQKTRNMSHGKQQQPVIHSISEVKERAFTKDGWSMRLK